MIGAPMARLILALVLAAAAVGGCSAVDGPPGGVYGGVDGGGDIRR